MSFAEYVAYLQYKEYDQAIEVARDAAQALLALQGASSQTIVFPLGTAAVEDSATSIPAGAEILSVSLEVDTPYTGGTTIEVGSTGSPGLLLAVGDNDPTKADTYQSTEPFSWPVASVVRATIAGAPVAGAGAVIVVYQATPQS